MKPCDQVGMPADELQRIRAYAKSRGWSDPFAAFGRHHAGAAKRGIEFRMTFKEWWDWWGEDYGRRGHGYDEMCMARNGDVGPYAIGNIYKATHRENCRDAATVVVEVDGKPTRVLKTKHAVIELLRERGYHQCRIPESWRRPL